MGEAWNVLSLGIPFNPNLCKFDLQMFRHRVVVGCVVRGDTEQLAAYVVLNENIVDSRGKVVAGVMIFENFKCEKRLMQIEFFIDIMTSDCYTKNKQHNK